MAKKSSKQNSTGPFYVPELNNTCKTLLANIGFAALDGDFKTICVTSSVPNEGKSTMSANLAIAMASSGKRVLLVENDMRRRSLGKMLNLAPEAGIVALLRGSATFKEALVPTEYPNLWFLNAEKGIANPSDVLSSTRYAHLVKYLKEKFDYVVFDTPPTLLFVDSSIVGSIADCTVLVVRQNETRRKAVKQAYSQLVSANANVLGVAMTFCEKSGDDYYYYYYYYYDEEGNKTKRRHKKKHGESGDVFYHINEEGDEQWGKHMGILVDSEDASGAERRGSQQEAASDAKRPDSSRAADAAGASGHASRAGEGALGPNVGSRRTDGDANVRGERVGMHGPK